MTRAPLVTGGTGFAGTHLIELLLEQHPVVHAWAHPSGRPAPRGEPRVRWRPVDLLDPELVARAIAEAPPGAIYHCGGIADVSASWSSPARALEVNALGTAHVLDAVHRASLDTRVLVTGSALVYRPSREPLTEESAIGPASPYGFSKLAQEMMALHGDGLQAIVARPFNHAGPGQSDAYVTSSIARQIVEAEAGMGPPVLRVGNMDTRRDITDVRDTVRAYVALMERGQQGRAYNVCSGRAYFIGDLIGMLVERARVSLRVEQDPARMRPSDNPIVAGDNTRLREATGWTPRIPMEQTLDDLLTYWRRRLPASTA